MILCKRSYFIQLNKLEIRKKYRQLRSEIQTHERNQAADAAARLLVSHPLFQGSRHIGCYYGHKDEFETKPLIEAIWKSDKVCYLPVLTDIKSLHFARYNRNDELQPNQHQIPEPVDHQLVTQAERLDLVLLPLVAFDLKGNRIGTGGGYYDRTFAFLFNKPQKAPFMLGLGFKIQECDDIQSDPWDIKLNGVLTESALLQF
jgi:5-formyltetrahydrofolate cyclo-ligase